MHVCEELVGSAARAFSRVDAVARASRVDAVSRASRVDVVARASLSRFDVPISCSFMLSRAEALFRVVFCFAASFAPGCESVPEYLNDDVS